MRPNVEFQVELPKTNPGLAKSHFQWNTRGYVQKTAPDKHFFYPLKHYVSIFSVIIFG